jgi:hypothetical protein
MRKSLLALATLATLAAFASVPAQAAIDTYTAFLYGANEVGGADVDGFGVATVSIDNVGNTVSWAILAMNIDVPLTGAHIHQAAAGVNGPVKIDFDAATTGQGLFDADLALITPTTAAGFYVNLHNAAYRGGAIRGQLQYVGTAAVVPEPATYALMLAGMAALGALAMRRKRQML